jgi:hypothetical protein
VSQGIKQSSSSRYNGATTLKKKQPEKARTFFVLAIRTSYCHSEKLSDSSLFLLEATTPSKSQDEISVRGKRCDTPSVTVAVTVLEH